ncbi:MAG: hypothetical protein ACXV9R_13745 [Methylobacter sp.]
MNTKGSDLIGAFFISAFRSSSGESGFQLKLVRSYNADEAFINVLHPAHLETVFYQPVMVILHGDGLNMTAFRGAFPVFLECVVLTVLPVLSPVSWRLTGPNDLLG